MEISETQQSTDGRGIAFGLAAGALWGGVFLAPHLLPAFTPLELSAGRYLAYGLLSAVLLAPLWARLRGKVTRQDWIALIRLSLAGNLVYYLFVAASVQLSGVAPASLIVGLIPVTATLMGMRDHREAELRRLAMPLLLIVTGIVCIHFDVLLYGPKDGGSGTSKVLGLLCAAGGLISWTLYTVWNARYLLRNPRFDSHEWSLLTGAATGSLALLLAVPAFAMPHANATPGAGRNWTKFWLVSFAVAVGASVIGNSLWNAASRRLPLTLSGQMIVFETLFALLYAFLYDARWPRPLEYAASLLLLTGVMWSARKHMAALE